jgi:hypothetical protein
LQYITGMRSAAAWFALIFIQFTAVNALADGACSTIDLRPKLGAPRDQGDSGWCFAHTAADLLSVKLGKRVSAYDLAIGHHLNDLKRLENSSSKEVREFLRNRALFNRIQEERVGYADDPSEPYLRKENFLRASTNIEETTHHGLIGMGGSEDVAILLAQERGFCLSSQLEDKTKNEMGFLKAVQRFHRSRRSQPLDPQFHDYGVADDYESKRMAESVVKYTDQQCRRRIQPRNKFTPYIRMYSQGIKDFRKQVSAGRIGLKSAQKSIWADIDSLLESGEASTIGYDAYDVMDRDDTSGQNPGQHGDHSSVIAGRKMIGGVCQYFLRNSWGKNCALYTTKFRSRCDKNGGGVWLKQSELPSVYSVVSLSRPATANQPALAAITAPANEGRD